MPSKRLLDPRERALVRDEVRQLLARAPSYRALPSDERRRLGASLEDAATTLVDGELGKRGGSLDAVDLPAFVSDLIRGTFAALVDASVQQMREYADLLGQATASVEDFVRDKPDVVSLREELAGLVRVVPAPAKRLLGRADRRPWVRKRDDDDDDDDDGDE